MCALEERERRVDLARHHGVATQRRAAETPRMKAEVEARARAICRQLAGLSLVAVQSVKACVRAALSSPLDAGLRYENEMNTLCFAAGDHREGIRAFQEKRPAEFKT
jgi:enoyl-CoA hydratase/carnithine racemase